MLIKNYNTLLIVFAVVGKNKVEVVGGAVTSKPKSFFMKWLGMRLVTKEHSLSIILICKSSITH